MNLSISNHSKIEFFFFQDHEVYGYYIMFQNHESKVYADRLCRDNLNELISTRAFTCRTSLPPTVE